MPLAADIRECPVTWGLAATWTLVFAAMLATQYALGVPAPTFGMGDPLGVSSVIGHRFGDLTWAEVQRGEAWRLITATFVHFGLIHIAMNVTALLKLGQLIEPWYGGGPFLAVCLAIGGLGNLVGGLLRVGVTAIRTLLAGTPPARVLPSWFDNGGPAGIEAAWNTPSGGGSTILLGLLGLGAVVGWRSKTRIGSFLRDQMVMALILTAALGFVLVNLLDNYGHAGGAIVGGAIGFVHRPLFRICERSRAFRGACWVLALGVIAASLAAAIRDDRGEATWRTQALSVEARFRLDDAALGDLDRLANLYAARVALAIKADTWDDHGGLDQIAVERSLKRLAVTPAQPLEDGPFNLTIEVPGGIRPAFEAALAGLEARSADSWGPDGAEALVEVRDRARRALDQAPKYRDVYAFALAWNRARGIVAEDWARAKAERVRLDRSVN